MAMGEWEEDTAPPLFIENKIEAVLKKTRMKQEESAKERWKSWHDNILNQS